LRRIAPTAKKIPGIDEAKITSAPALHRSEPAGTSATKGTNREKKIDAKKRNIKYGLYG
jgi:hypothetical protein